MKELIRKGDPKDQVVASWLCQVLQNEELQRTIPVLHTELDHQQAIVKKIKKKAPDTKIYVNGEEH